MPIRFFFNQKSKPKFYRLRIIAPDGRFQSENLVGGIDEKTMKYEAKMANDNGMLVDVFPESGNKT